MPAPLLLDPALPPVGPLALPPVALGAPPNMVKLAVEPESQALRPLPAMSASGSVSRRILPRRWQLRSVGRPSIEAALE